jgi:hypothetical protein
MKRKAKAKKLRSEQYTEYSHEICDGGAIGPEKRDSFMRYTRRLIIYSAGRKMIPSLFYMNYLFRQIK